MQILFKFFKMWLMSDVSTLAKAAQVVYLLFTILNAVNLHQGFPIFFTSAPLKKFVLTSHPYYL